MSSSPIVGANGVGIARREAALRAVVDPELVGHGQRSSGDRALEEPVGVDPLERRDLTTDHHVDGLRPGPVGPHDETAAVDGVGAEEGVRL
jgi:hypothetical protein